MSSRIQTGIAGEHFVAAELSKRGWIATLTAKNTPGVDVLATRLESDVFARIQVKTRTAAYKYAWRVGKQFTPADAVDFVLLVDLAEDEPHYWVIPTQVANELIASDQLRTKDVSQFEGRWDLLEGAS